MKRGITVNTHPSELIYEDILKENKLTISKAAELLKVTRTTLSNVLNGKASVSPNMAIRLEMVFGGSAAFWLRMQADYDLGIAEPNFESASMKLKRYNFQIL